MTREKTVLYINNDHDCPPTNLLRRIALTSELSTLTNDRAVYALNQRERTTLYTRYPANISPLNKSRCGYNRKKRSSLEMQRLHNLKRQERVLSEPIHLPAIGRHVGPGIPSYSLRNVASSLEHAGRDAPRSRWRLTHGHTSTYRSADSVTVHKAVSYDMGDRLGDITDLKASVRRQMERYREWHEEQKRRQLHEVRQVTSQVRHWQDERLQCPGVSKEIVQRRTTRAKCPVYHALDRSGVVKATGMEKVAEQTGCSRDIERAHRSIKNLHNVTGLPPVGSSVDCNDVVRMRPQVVCVDKSPEKRVAANADCSPMPEGLEFFARDNGSSASEESRPESLPAKVPSELRVRVFSAKTWRTWRSVNESDAYKDVKQYIEDNDLMSDEKSSRIQEWMAGVGPPDSTSPVDAGEDQQEVCSQ